MERISRQDIHFTLVLENGLMMVADEQEGDAYRCTHTVVPILWISAACVLHFMASFFYLSNVAQQQQPPLSTIAPFLVADHHAIAVASRTNSLPNGDDAQKTPGFTYFNAEGLVSGANQETMQWSYLLECWDANNLTHSQKSRYHFHAFDVRDYGAVGDNGRTLNTHAFQTAFAAAANATIENTSSRHGDVARTNVGIVVVRNGIYKVGGAIDLYSYTFLYVDESAVVLGSSMEVDFPYPDAWESEGNPLFPQGILPILVRAKHQHHLGILGQGIIDGGALPGFIQGFNASLDRFEPRRFRQSGVTDPPCQGECRPQLVLLERCDTVIVQDITLQNSPDWTLHVRGSSNAILTRLRVFGDWRWPNNDGVDVDSCHNVTVSYSTIDTADDAICIKTSKGYGTASNILVHNNLLKSRSSAFKIGSSTEEDVSHVFVDHLTIQAGSNRALAIQHRDGGTIANIHIRNVVIESTELQPQHWWGTGEAIYLTSTPRFATNWPLGRVVNVTFENILAYSVAGTSFVGYRPSPAAVPHAPDSNIDKKDSGVDLDGTMTSNIVFLYVQICMKTKPGYDRNPSGRIRYERPSRDYRPTDLEPELEAYPADQEIGLFLDHVMGAANHKQTPGVLFHQSAICFPPFSEVQMVGAQLLLDRKITLGGTKKQIQICLATDGLQENNTGLACHLGEVCFPCYSGRIEEADPNLADN